MTEFSLGDEVIRASIRNALYKAKSALHQYNEGLITHPDLYHTLSIGVADIMATGVIFPHLNLGLLISITSADQYATFIIHSAMMSTDRFYKLAGDDVFHWLSTVQV